MCLDRIGRLRCSLMMRLGMARFGRRIDQPRSDACDKTSGGRIISDISDAENEADAEVRA
jgi:hypothetical protein